MEWWTDLAPGGTSAGNCGHAHALKGGEKNCRTPTPLSAHPRVYHSLVQIFTGTSLFCKLVTKRKERSPRLSVTDCTSGRPTGDGATVS